MEIKITQEILDEVNMFMNNGLVQLLNDIGMSFPALAFITQSIVSAVDEAQEELDKDKKIC